MQNLLIPSNTSISTSDQSNQLTYDRPTISSLDSLDSEIIRKPYSKDRPIYPPSKVLLFKGIPDDATEMEILQYCRPFGTLKDILLTKHKRYAFIQFEAVEEAVRCYQIFCESPPFIRQFSLYVFYTGKDQIIRPETVINRPTRFLHLVFSKDHIEKDVSKILSMLSPFGKCLKIVFFQSNPTQVFVEMEDIVQAINAKESLDNKTTFYRHVSYIEEKDFFARREDTMEIYPALDFTSLYPFANNCAPIPLTSVPIHTNFYPITEPPTQGDLRLFRHPSHQASSYNMVSLIPREQLNKSMNMLSPLGQVKDEKVTNILLVKNLPEGITAKKLFRLFGAYGNVLKVKIFFKTPDTALVEFQNYLQANLAKAYLNNCPLFGSNILISNSRQGVVIDTSMLKKGEENMLTGDYNHSIEHRYRFAGSKNHYNIAGPSKVLHISNLCEDKKEEFYVELFKDYGEVKNFIFLKGKDKMALVEMRSVEEAVTILIDFHNYNVDGKFLKVSFSKYARIKEVQ